ncbi:MAG: PEP-CTERM sorting domain-containing protein [Fimbriimonadales bacterium]
MTKLSLAAIAIFIAPGASADLLYDLSPHDPQLAFASDSVPGQFNNQRLAEAFTIGSPSEIQRFKWWGRSEGAFFSDLRNMESFTMAVFADDAGMPGTELASETALTEDIAPIEVGEDPFGIPIWEFDFTMDSSLAVAPGNYWFSVGSDNFDPDGDGFYWQAAVPSVSNNFAAQIPVGSDWEISGFADLSFQIHGVVVPEPATLAAVAAGLAFAVSRRRCR